MIVAVLLTTPTFLAGLYAVQLVRTARARGELKPKVEGIAIGAVANFFDALGIGSFAPTTAWLRFRKLAPDSFLPAVLNAGHCLPTVRSEEHTSELQSLMRISYAVFCLKKKKYYITI